VTPEAIDLVTAALSAELSEPPTLMLATAGLTACAVTQSMPPMIAEYEPEPVQSSTRTPTSLTSLATPYVRPPTVPATWVPWPLQSCAVESLSMKSQPEVARPPNSAWLVRMPVSSTYTVTSAAER
jgi:hypothetical protein